MMIALWIVFGLKMFSKIIKSTNAEIVTGPQIPLKKKSLNKFKFD